MAIIAATKQNPNKPETGFVKFDDDSEAWTNDYAGATQLVGKPVPSDWTLRDGDKGKQLLAPKKGGATAYRNTREGFLLEQDAILRSVALQQAVASGVGITTEIAEKFYNWLSGGASSSKVEDEYRNLYDAWMTKLRLEQVERGSADPHQPSPGDVQGSGGKADASGFLQSPPSGPCSHVAVSPLKMDGTDLPSSFVRCVDCGLVYKPKKATT